jgi:tRNA (guanine-N7-)-methyltransferase
MESARVEPPTAQAIRTFKYRRGRATSGQQRALDELWPAYGVDVAGTPPDWAAVFGRTAPLVLEIGFGMGDATVAMAQADPGRDVIAVDVHTPGVGSLLHRLAGAGLRNIRVVLGDALPVIEQMVPPGSLDEVRVYFPDPWPKTRHRKRRLVGQQFAALVADRLVAGGRLHCATDWAPYAEQMIEVVAAEPLLDNVHDGFAPRPAERPVTRYERIGLARGHQVYDVIAVRRPAS